MEEYVADWSSLPTEMLETIARCCTIMEDFMAFRGVCTSWRAAAAKDVFVSVSKVPHLMLAEKDDTDEREFYSLAKRKICTRIPLPDLLGKRCNDVGFGWILTKSPSGEVWLMKPFSSSARIQLPNFMEFPDYPEHMIRPEAQFIQRAWLTANPSETVKFTLLVGGRCYVGYWRNGDKSWSKLETIRWSALTYWKGKMYVLGLKSNLLVWDCHDFSKSPVLVLMKNSITFMTNAWKDYLVGGYGDHLLLIRRNNTSGLEHAYRGADHFGLWIVDLVRGELIERSGLGKHAVFLGDNAPVCVDATEFPGILKSNCIYFTDDLYGAYCHSGLLRKGGGKDMGIYNARDGSIERFDVDSQSFICPPMWVFPSF